MRKHVKPECPYCGSHDISGWYNEHNIEYVVRCNECGATDYVANIKFIEAFPKWFEILGDVGETND